MSNHASVVQKLETLLARVSKRTAEPRAPSPADVAFDGAVTTAPPPLVGFLLPETDARPVPAGASREAGFVSAGGFAAAARLPSEAPPAPIAAASADAAAETVAVQAPVAAATSPSWEDEATAVIVYDEEQLIPVEESSSDGALTVVEATVVEATVVDVGPLAAGTQPPQAARTAPPPPAEAPLVAASPVVHDVASRPRSEPPPDTAVSDATTTAPAASDAAVAEAAARTAAVVAAESAADGDEPEAHLPEAGEAPAAETGSPIAAAVEAAVVAVVELVIGAAGARADATHALDGSRTEPPPDFLREAPPLELLADASNASPERQIAADHDLEAKPPSSSKRVRGDTLPPGAAGMDESGARAIPERGSSAAPPAQTAELSLLVQGAVVARTPVSGDVAAFVSAARAHPPELFGTWLDETLALGVD